jgi:hypothetical protein
MIKNKLMQVWQKSITVLCPKKLNQWLVFLLIVLFINTANAADGYRYLRFTMHGSNAHVQKFEWLVSNVAYPTEALTKSNTANSVGNVVIATNNWDADYKCYDHSTGTFGGNSSTSWTVTLDMGEGNEITPSQARFTKHASWVVVDRVVCEFSNSLSSGWMEVADANANFDENMVWTFDLSVQSDADLLADAKTDLSLGDLSSPITENLTLPDSEGAASIAWAVTAGSGINNLGVITRPAVGESDALATLTATLNVGAESDTKDFNVTVKALQPISDTDKLATAKDSLELEGISGLVDDISLPTTLSLTDENGDAFTANVVWEVTAGSGIDNTGVVTRPEVGESDATATLTATLTVGEETSTKAFEITVIAKTDKFRYLRVNILGFTGNGGNVYQIKWYSSDKIEYPTSAISNVVFDKDSSLANQWVAGLGLIEIARNSHHTLKHNVSKVDNNISCFELHIKISNNLKKQ